MKKSILEKLEKQEATEIELSNIPLDPKRFSDSAEI
jgi:hypothetical protein